MDAEIDQKTCEYFLLKWARFSRGSRGGWPANSITGALMDQYEVGIRNEGDFATEHIPEDVAIVDSVIAKLPGVTRKVMLVYWMNTKAPREVHGRMMKCSGRHFERLFKAAMLVFAARFAPYRLYV